MPNSRKYENRDKHKKTKYSSDSDDNDRLRSRRYGGRPRSKKKDEKERSSKNDKGRRKRYSSSSSSGSSSSRRSDSSSRDSRKSPPRSGRTHDAKSSSKDFDHVTKFEINDLYKEEEKGKKINEIEADSFKQTAFQSTKKIVVNLQKDQILVPLSAESNPEEESLIHPNFLGDENVKVDKWIKKLSMYRN